MGPDPLQGPLCYRSLYGKVYAGLVHHFGTSYLAEIEDAVQNAILKLVKLERSGYIPSRTEDWLCVVARNDVFGQWKKKNSLLRKMDATEDPASAEDLQEDLRLQTLVFVSSLKSVSNRAKVIFLLKNIFGFGVKEIKVYAYGCRGVV